jgi:hypothetical protein
MIEVKEEFRIPGTNILLETGDKIEVLQERLIPIEWSDNQEVMDEVYSALEDARIRVRGGDPITFTIGKENYAIELYKVG